MAERRCEECGSIIPNGATACPNCGCPIEDTQDNGQANKNGWQAESALYMITSTRKSRIHLSNLTLGFSVTLGQCITILLVRWIGSIPL